MSKDREVYQKSRENTMGVWGRLEDVIMNLESKEISLIERIISLMNININLDV